MWALDEIEIWNLFTHTHTKYKFKRNRTVLCLGENLDDRGANSNGAGKSTLIEGVTLAITGDVYRDIGKDNFIQTGKTDCRVDLLMRNDVLKKSMKIERKLFIGTKSSTVAIYENDVRLKHITSVPNANKHILKEIGINIEDILNYFIIGQGNDNTFFTAKDAKQKEIISRFSNTSIVDDAIETIKGEVSVLDAQLRELNGLLKNEENIIAELQSQVDELQSDDNNEIAEELSKKVDRTISRVNDCESNIEAKQKDLKIVIKELDIFKLRNKIDKTIALNKQIEEKELSYDELSDKFQGNKVLASKLNAIIDGKIECPKCGEKFVLDIMCTLEQTETQLSELLIKQESLKTSKGELKKEIEGLNEQLEKEKDNKKKGKSIERKVNEITEQIAEEEQTLERQMKLMIKYKEELSDAKSKTKHDKQLSTLNKKIKERNKLVKELDETKSSLNRDYQDKQQLLFHMSKSGFKTYLANMSIKNIQNLSNYWLNKFDTNLSVSIAGYKVLKSGDISDKITVIVLKSDTGKEGLFQQYSGGEKGRVVLAGALAIHSLINNTVEYGKGLDFILFDESISYLDESGQIEALKIIKSSGISSLVVMQQVKGIGITDKIVFTKKGGVTTIKAA